MIIGYRCGVCYEEFYRDKNKSEQEHKCPKCNNLPVWRITEDEGFILI